MAEYIEREKVIHEIDTWIDSVGIALVGKGLSYYRKLLGCVEDVPATDVEPVRHGEWVPFHSKAAGDIQYCSACNVGCPHKPNYCPHCGAKMDGDTE